MEFQLLEQRPRALLDFSAIEPVHFSGKANDFAAAQIVMKDGFVGEIPDAPLDFDAILKAIEAVDSGGTGSGSKNSHKHANGRGLARPIGAEEGEDLPIRNGQIEIFHGVESAIAFREASDFD
jgi:hypothetical protein